MKDQKRFILAMAISGLLVLVWQQYFAPPPPVPQDDTTQVVQKDTATDAEGTQATTDTSPSEATPPVELSPRNDVPVSSQTLTTKNFSVTLTNAGGKVTGIELLDPEQYQAAGNLLDGFPEDSKRFPFGLKFDKGALNIPADAVFEVAASSPSEVVYRWDDPQGKYRFEKLYKVNAAHPYLLDFDVKITNLAQSGSLSDLMQLEITGYKSEEEKSGFFSFLDFRPDELESICRLEDDTERELYSAIDEVQTFEAPVVWGAINTRYFFWGVIPEKPGKRCVLAKDGGYMTTTLDWAEFSVAAGATHTYKQKLYAGPKDIDVLNAIGSDLNESVDYGILTILAKPMRWLLNFFQSFVGNWGLAIILLTLLIKIATWPFTEKSYANAERMKEIQPQLDAIRKEHENDQQRLAEETMKLFKENSFNPLGGCLPMVLQMPILYGLYVMIINSVELFHADFFLWYTDLSARDPYFVLPLFMGVMMFLQQQFMTPKSTDPKQAQTQAMMKFMPIMFTAFMLFLPAGLVLYYSLNLVLGVLQQWLIRRKFARRREAKAAAA